MCPSANTCIKFNIHHSTPSAGNTTFLEFWCIFPLIFSSNFALFHIRQIFHVSQFSLFRCCSFVCSLITVQYPKPLNAALNFQLQEQHGKTSCLLVSFRTFNRDFRLNTTVSKCGNFFRILFYALTPTLFTVH